MDLIGLTIAPKKNLEKAPIESTMIDLYNNPKNVDHVCNFYKVVIKL